MAETAYSLMFHDVVPPGAFSSSGISGPDADAYKIEQADFKRHLDSIRQVVPNGVRTCVETWSAAVTPVFLTFDDGGASSPWIADELERYGWRGHFFIVSDWVGRPEFVTAAQVRELALRGHIMGSHSKTHPVPISKLADADLEREWNESTQSLSDLIGRAVTVASVPGGFYSQAVGRSAIAAGIQYLFTSEPSSSVTEYEGSRLIGRYFIRQGMGPRHSASFSGGPDPGPRIQQAMAWKAKKVAKAVGGNAYLAFRKAIFASRARSAG
jgi:peptidoglycan/xylan/chitin deacetylase (PgdA/CDA1 family)